MAMLKPRKILKKLETAQKSVSSLSDQLKLQSEKLGFNVQAFDYANAESTLSILAKYNPWVSASIRAIVRNSNQPILKMFDPATGDDITIPEIDGLMIRPHPLFDWSKWLKFNVFYNIHSGVAYNYIIRNTAGKPIALQPIPSELVTIDNAALQSGRIEYIIMMSGEQPRVSESDMLVWQDFEYITTYYQGTSRLKHLMFSIINKNMADRYNKSSFENGGEIKGVLTSPSKLTRQDAEQMAEQLRGTHGGPDNAGKTMILGNGTTYAKTGQTNAEMGFEQLQKVSQTEVNAIFHVPSIEMGLDSANYATAKEQRKVFWETMMQPTMDSLADVLTKFVQREFKTPYRFYFDYSSIAVLQQDINIKLQSAMLMQTMGYDNDTITSMFDLPAITAITPMAPPALTPQNNSGGVIIEPKSFGIKSDVPYLTYRNNMKMEFLKGHRASESTFERSIAKYFLRQRNAIMDYIKTIYGLKAVEPGNLLGGFDTWFKQNMQVWNDEIETMAGAYFNATNNGLVKSMIEKYGLKFTDSVKSTMKINNHAKKIVQINDTTNRLAYEAIKRAYDLGVENMQGPAEIAQGILESVRAQYLVNERRALLIARTETTSVTNDLIRTNFEENGVTEKEWLTSQDELVRGPEDSFNHQAMENNALGIVPINEYFQVPGKSGVNPIMHPGDMVNGEAGNVCNCRCTMLPR